MVDHLTDEYRGYYIDLYSPALPGGLWRAVVVQQETGDVLGGDAPLQAVDLMSIRALVEGMIDVAADVRDAQDARVTPVPGREQNKA